MNVRPFYITCHFDLVQYSVRAISSAHLPTILFMKKRGEKKLFDNNPSSRKFNHSNSQELRNLTCSTTALIHTLHRHACDSTSASALLSPIQYIKVFDQLRTIELLQPNKILKKRSITGTRVSGLIKAEEITPLQIDGSNSHRCMCVGQPTKCSECLGLTYDG